MGTKRKAPAAAPPPEPSADAPTKNERRAGAVLVLLTPAERDALRVAAARDGLALGSWLRHLGIERARFTAAAPVATPGPVPPAAAPRRRGPKS